MSRIRKGDSSVLSLAILLTVNLLHQSAVALTFEFTSGPGLTAAATSGTPDEMAAAMGLAASASLAGAEYESSFADPIVVKFEIDVVTLGDPSIIGYFDTTAPGVFSTFEYSAIKGSLTADLTTVDDTMAVGSLQPGPSLFMVTNDTTGTPSPRITIAPDAMTGDDMFEYNTTMRLTRANQKALGLLPGADGAAGADGKLVINSSFLSTSEMDFDPSDGIGSSLLDAVTFLKHEIGHGLGFVSGVDEIDFSGEAAPIRFRPDPPGYGDPDLTDDAIFSALDLYRYSDDSLGKSDQPATGATLDLAFGPPTGGGLKPFFSIDGGTTALTTFATGAFNGDDDQASHWEDMDPMSAGLMDPDLADGESVMLSPIDLLAFDVIGYDFVVPEPDSGSLLLWSLLASAVGFRRRR